jgi:hypothetical protein
LVLSEELTHLNKKTSLKIILGVVVSGCHKGSGDSLFHSHAFLVLVPRSLPSSIKSSIGNKAFYIVVGESLDEDEAEEKNRLITEVLELQNTLDGE